MTTENPYAEIERIRRNNQIQSQEKANRDTSESLDVLCEIRDLLKILVDKP